MYALDSPPPTPPLRVTVGAVDGIVAGLPVHEAAPEVVYDSVLEATTHVFHERVGVVVPLTVAAAQAPGALTLPVEVTFTVCNARICLPPKRLPLTAAVQIGIALRPPRPPRSTPAPAPAPQAALPDTHPPLPPCPIRL